MTTQNTHPFTPDYFKLILFRMNKAAESIEYTYDISTYRNPRTYILFA